MANRIGKQNLHGALAQLSTLSDKCLSALLVPQETGNSIPFVRLWEIPQYFTASAGNSATAVLGFPKVAISSKQHQYFPEVQNSTHSLSTPFSFWGVKLDGVVPMGGASGHWDTTVEQDLWGLQSSVSLYQMMDADSSHFGDHRESFWFKFVFSLAPYESRAHTQGSVCHWITFEPF